MMCSVEPRGFIERFTDWCRKAVRWHVVVHCGASPKAGELVAWTTEGGEIIAPIVDVDYCVDPHDLMTLTVYVTPPCRNFYPR